MNCRLQFLQRSLRGGEGPLRDAYLILHFQSSLDADPERVSRLPLLLSCPSPAGFSEFCCYLLLEAPWPGGGAGGQRGGGGGWGGGGGGFCLLGLGVWLSPFPCPSQAAVLDSELKFETQE